MAGPDPLPARPPPLKNQDSTRLYERDSPTHVFSDRPASASSYCACAIPSYSPCPPPPLLHARARFRPAAKRAFGKLRGREKMREACFDPPLELAPTRNPNTYPKRTTDAVRHDFASLLVKNKNLLAELRNLQNKLLMKESSLKEIKSELESYKENNVHQSIQIKSLKNDIKGLEKLTASLTRIKSLKNINIKSLERGNWDLLERITELENRLRIHLVEREKAERKADLLEKKLASGSIFIPYFHIKGEEYLLGKQVDYRSTKKALKEEIELLQNKDDAILVKTVEKDNIFHSEGPKNGQKIWQRDLTHKINQNCELKSSYSLDWETKTMESHYQKFLSQLAILLSNSEGPIPATEEAVKERIEEIVANEQSWKSRTEGLQQEIQMLTRQLEQLHHRCKKTTQESLQIKEQKNPQCLEGKIVTDNVFQLVLDRNNVNAKTKNSQIDEHSRMFKHLEKDSMQHKVLNIQQNLEISTTQRLEEKIQKLQKHLSDLKLSNKNMKSQLTRVNILKDKTIKKLRQSLIKAETMRGKTLKKTDNLKTASDSAKHEERTVKENQQVLKATSPELCPAKSSLEEVSGQQELLNFQETIKKMLGFNVKAAHNEIINHLRLIIQVYEASEKSKINPDCETGKENE